MKRRLTSFERSLGSQAMRPTRRVWRPAFTAAFCMGDSPTYGL